MRPQQHEADHFARHALVQQIPHREEIAKALGHLPALDLQHLIMHPDPREPPLGVHAHALRNLVFVVRELQINAARVDVKTRPQERVAHRRAFDVPARPPPAPGAVPPRQIVARRFPEHEIHRVALVGRHLHPRPGDHVIDRAPRKRAIFGVSCARRTAHAPRPHRHARARSAPSIIATIWPIYSVARGSLRWAASAPSASMSA